MKLRLIPSMWKGSVRVVLAWTRDGILWHSKVVWWKGPLW